MTRLSFHDAGSGVSVSEVPVSFRGGRMQKVVIRIDGRGPRVRVDRWTVGPWEAIDGGDGFSSRPDAEAFAARWVEAARTQNTIEPRLS